MIDVRCPAHGSQGLAWEVSLCRKRWGIGWGLSGSGNVDVPWETLASYMRQAHAVLSCATCKRWRSITATRSQNT